MEGLLTGAILQHITHLEFSWGFAFDAASLTGNCPWRIVSDGRLILTSEDDGQKFGLPEPVDAEARAGAELLKARVAVVAVDAETADLRITFANGARLELLSTSAGYEAWQLNTPTSCIVAGSQGQLSEARYVKPNLMVGGPWE
ncbi:MAG: hypothetical protein JSR98_07065 [Proteobacteria bacterium]|nr:hypothetical protein [Pseudomonadota bacterium]